MQQRGLAARLGNDSETLKELFINQIGLSEEAYAIKEYKRHPSISWLYESLSATSTRQNPLSIHLEGTIDRDLQGVKSLQESVDLALLVRSYVTVEDWEMDNFIRDYPWKELERSELVQQIVLTKRHGKALLKLQPSEDSTDQPHLPFSIRPPWIDNQVLEKIQIEMMVNISRWADLMDGLERRNRTLLQQALKMSRHFQEVSINQEKLRVVNKVRSIPVIAYAAALEVKDRASLENGRFINGTMAQKKVVPQNFSLSDPSTVARFAKATFIQKYAEEILEQLRFGDFGLNQLISVDVIKSIISDPNALSEHAQSIFEIWRTSKESV